jgi:uncharacterized protein (DUF302 family)
LQYGLVRRNPPLTTIQLTIHSWSFGADSQLDAAIDYLKQQISQDPQGAIMSANGIVDIRSNHSVDATVENLKRILEARSVTLFAIVDHSGEAAKVGMVMRPTKLLIFGSPKAGTPLMLAAPGIAIDLPLKILVWEDQTGQAWVSYNSPEYLRSRHNLPAELMANIAVIEVLAAKAAE